MLVDSTLPVSHYDAIAAGRQDRAAQRVLLVDDDPIVLRITSASLRRAGLDVVAVPDGDAALTALEQAGPFDALITDYAMPGLTGLELIEQASARAPDLPALMVTGYGAAVALNRLPPTVRVLAKPHTRVEFLSCVAAMVGSTAPPAPAMLAANDA